MLHSPKFRFHVGLLHEHWLTKTARGTPQRDWPDASTPRWIVADRHAATAGAMEGFEGAAGDDGFAGGWKAFVGSSQTVQTVLLDLKEKRPTAQDRQVVYADVTKKHGQAASILSDSVSPAVAVALVDQFLATVSAQAGGAAATRTGGSLRRQPRHCRLPARTSNKRRRGAAEKYTRAGSKRAATSGSST